MNYYNLFIGNNHNDLKAAESDAAEVQEFFHRLGYDNENNSIILTGENATRTNIMKGIENLSHFDESDDFDLLIFYLAGHLMIDHRANKTVKSENIIFIPNGFQAEHPVTTGVPLPNMLDRVFHSEARQKIIILDSCHSGSGIENLPLGPWQKPEEANEVLIFASSFPEAVSREIEYTEDVYRGKFTSSILDYLNQNLEDDQVFLHDMIGQMQDDISMDGCYASQSAISSRVPIRVLKELTHTDTLLIRNYLENSLRVQKVFRSLCKFFGCAGAISLSSASGNTLSGMVNFSSFCKLMRETDETVELCQKSDKALLDKSKSTRGFALQKCEAGLFDFAGLRDVP